MASFFVANYIKLIFLIFDYDDLFNFVTLSDLIDNIKTFHNLAKTGMVSVQVPCVFSVVADEKLGTSRISTSMSHGQYSSVMILVISSKFTINFVARTSCTVANRTATLDYKVWNYPMECQAVIETFFG